MRVKPRANAGTSATPPPSKRLGSGGSSRLKSGEEDTYTLANLPNVVMIELQPHIYPRLDISVRAIKARSSLIYSPNTAWELGYTERILQWLF